MADDPRYVLIGTAGHIDHGKTALVKMLTGCETDTLREEKERGLTIDLGFAPCEIRGDLMACLVDVPGHEKFIRNMVAGASGIDAVLLVVAANDSVMPQTIEHLRIVELLGIRRGLVAVTKIDMVDEDLRELVVEEVKDLLEGTFLQGAPICPVSSITGEGLEGLWTAVAEVVDACADRPVQGIFRMPVERVFTLAGFGTVATGMPSSGRIRIGDRLELLPQGQAGRLRGLQVYGKGSELGWAGQCLALNIADVDYNAVARGDVLATPGYLKSARMLLARLHLLPGAERPLKHQAPVRLHTGTTEVMGRIFHLDRDRLDPGESALVQFRGEAPLVAGTGDRFVIRQYSPVVTIGGGRILRTGNRKVKRFREGVLRDLAALEASLDDEKAHVTYLLDRAGSRSARPEDLRAPSLLPEDRIEEILSELSAEGSAVALGASGAFVSSAALAEVEEKVLAELSGFHGAHPHRAGIDLAGLKRASDVDPNLIELATGRLFDRGRLRRDGEFLALADHRVALSAKEKTLVEDLLTLLEEAGVTPPEAGRIAAVTGQPEARVRRVLETLADQGAVVRLSESIYAHRSGEDRAREALVGWLTERGQIGVVDYRNLLGASRKYVYAWLDHFDAIGVTYRAENLRYLRAR